ncbi:RNA-binding ATPase activator esf2 [Entophlyctis sp. JEL0112]|nr:RNA-binding ATPase activator esf2 [Entophlyctis sp. JEL0112]
MSRKKTKFTHPLADGDQDDDDGGVEISDSETAQSIPKKGGSGSRKLQNKSRADPRFSTDKFSSFADASDEDNDDVDDGNSEEDIDEDDGDNGDQDEDEAASQVSNESDREEPTEEGESGAEDGLDFTELSSTAEMTSVKKPITLESLKSFKDTLNNTGLVYISRLPPFMSPAKLRQLLSKHGRLGRLYAAPEDAKTAYRRKKYRGNKRVNYTEAWVEFEDKKVARRTAEALNLRPMGEKKRDRFYDDLWNIKYLPRFKWHHLTDQIAYERAVRDQKLRAETEQVKRETKAYMKNVERGKMIEAMEEKRKRKLEKANEDTSSGNGNAGSALPASDSARASFNAMERKFRQRQVKVNDAKMKGGSKSASKATVLAKIFG